MPFRQVHCALKGLAKLKPECAENFLANIFLTGSNLSTD